MKRLRLQRLTIVLHEIGGHPSRLPADLLAPPPIPGLPHRLFPALAVAGRRQAIEEAKFGGPATRPRTRSLGCRSCEPSSLRHPAPARAHRASVWPTRTASRTWRRATCWTEHVADEDTLGLEAKAYLDAGDLVPDRLRHRHDHRGRRPGPRRWPFIIEGRVSAHGGPGGGGLRVGPGARPHLRHRRVPRGARGRTRAPLARSG